MDPLTRLRHEIHLESARIAPQTSGLIEAAREYIEYVEREKGLNRQRSFSSMEPGEMSSGFYKRWVDPWK